LHQARIDSITGRNIKSFIMDTSEQRIDPRNVNGWGVDADPENEPTYPMKKYTGDDHLRLNYEHPPQQAMVVEVLHSNERPGLPAVFGTSTPPWGLSGAIRRRAFTYSEGRYAHWLMLLLADRVNVIEAFIKQARQGRLPNIPAEKGWKASWKYNRKASTVKLITAVAVITVLLLLRKKRRKGYA
jgi:hypothetical protein